MYWCRPGNWHALLLSAQKVLLVRYGLDDGVLCCQQRCKHIKIASAGDDGDDDENTCSNALLAGLCCMACS
jgi:hypothetical protein